MPLTTDPMGRFTNIDLFSISFPMFDGGKMVVCVASGNALQDIAAPAGRHLEPIEELFKSFREEIEGIASQKYDDGRVQPDGKVLIVNGDIKS